MTVAPPLAPPASDELEALIREARVRQRRRRLAVAAALVAAGVAAGAGVVVGGGAGTARRTGAGPPAAVASSERRIEQVARRTFITEAGISGGVGWAMNGLGLWVTGDGGRSWITSTPRHVRNIGDAIARIEQIQFVDREHGWLTATDVFGGFKLPPRAPSLRHMEVDRTTDGGRTWRASVPPGCLQSCGGTYISFLDTSRGFAIASRGLFLTRDGGATWTRISRPRFVGAIDFLDLRRGFGVSDGGIPYGTSDGGRTWTRVLLPVPAGYAGWGRTADPVAFFGAEGLLPVRFRNPRTHIQRLVVYTSGDRGESWKAHRVPARVDWSRSFFTWGFPESGLFSPASRTVWFVNGRHVLFMTANAGRSWHTVRPLDLPRRAWMWSAQFTSADDGWAIFWLPSVAGGSGVLVHTTDGGLTWAPLAPPVPKPRPPPPATPACGSSCARP